MLQPNDADHFLDDIGPAVDVAPPCRHADGPVAADTDGNPVLIVDMRRFARYREAQLFKDTLLFVGGDVYARQREAAFGRIGAPWPAA